MGIKNAIKIRSKILLQKNIKWKKKVDIRKNSSDILKEIIGKIEELNNAQQKEAEDIIKKIIKYKNIDESSKIGNITLDVEKIKAIKENIYKCVIYNEDTTQLGYIKELLGQTSPKEKEWLLSGTEHIKNNECPFCKSNIEINNISTIIDNGEEIINKLNDLEKQLLTLKEEQASIIQYKLDSNNLHRDCSTEEIYTSQSIKMEEIEKLLQEINMCFSKTDTNIETSSKQVTNLRN